MEKCKKRKKWMSSMKGTTPLVSSTTIKTKIGWCAVVATGKVVLRIVIGFPERKQLLKQILKEFGTAIEKKSARMSITDEMKQYFSGKEVFLFFSGDQGRGALHAAHPLFPLFTFFHKYKSSSLLRR